MVRCGNPVVSNSENWRPPHAYVPGVTPRHAEDLFDFLKTGVVSCALNNLPETAAWQHGMAFLQEGYFWEAHELFESLWMACPPNSAEKLFVQSVIQQANAALKRKMGQHSAAEKIARHAQTLHAEAMQRSPERLFGRSFNAL